jgi:signal transduction histidine kinase
LLDSSAIELGAIQLQISCINAQDVWENVLVNLNETARKKQQTIVQRIEADCMVFADAIRLYQIFENLCSNAIKYSPIGAQILVVLETRGSNLRFLVEDEGQGIAESDKAKLFGLFQKLSATPTAGESSHGVGLAIVKQIVDAHGGTIRVEVASKGKGTVFIVELPLQSERAISQNHLSEVQL